MLHSYRQQQSVYSLLRGKKHCLRGRINATMTSELGHGSSAQIAEREARVHPNQDKCV